ncbi:MAG: pseudouridine synthase [Actinobacteria bacterium]|nr:pseudouridine synthase [Actinomycetota bacterium]
MEERLQKVLAHAGLASRRAVEEMIVGGRIRVNGEPARLGQRIDPAKDEVEVDGSRVPLRADLVWYLLNKPRGVVSTASDPEGRTTVVDLIDAPTRVWPVGRLDVDSEGAVIVTNDGELTHRLTHPSHAAPKTYLVEVGGGLTEPALRRLARGVRLEDGPAKPVSVRLVDRRPGAALIEVTITEGRNRQVRRMIEAVGGRVTRLVRVSIGPLMLGRLKPGTARRLAPAEVRSLYKSVDL